MLKIGNGPVSWGVIENTPGQRTDYAQVLDEMREAGYAGTELGDWGFMPTDPAQLRGELKARGLVLLAAWVGMAFAQREAHADGEARAVRTARLLADVAGESAFMVQGDDHSTEDVRTQNAGRIRPEHGLSDEGWKVFAEGVQRIARAVREQTGLRSVFHPHCATWVETPDETENLLSLTDPEWVGLCFDSGHYRFGGGDPMTGLKKHADRIRHVHFKDCDPSIAGRSRAEGWDYAQSIGHGVFCELGKGDVDFPAVLALLKEIGYDGWIVVEQDVLPGRGSPKASAKRSREYLRNLGL